ncbi:MAG: hypothetical protein ABIG85_00760 [Chloroflexota bacterium]
MPAENREAAGIVAGDEVDVEVELDAEPREVTVPPAAAVRGTAGPRPEPTTVVRSGGTLRVPW